MPLSPIRGAPPGAPIPDFPRDAPAAKPAQHSAAPVVPPDQAEAPLPRRRQTPIEFHDDGSVLTFRVTPEIPAITRSSMTIQMGTLPMATSALHTLQMSTAEAK